MQRDADGDQFFGFCGVRVYVPDDDPRPDATAEEVVQQVIDETLAKQKRAAGHEPANARVQPPTEGAQRP